MLCMHLIVFYQKYFSKKTCLYDPTCSQYMLEAINNFLTEDKPEWEGTATELVSQLPDMQIQANVLSRKLNVVNSQLLNNYGIFYDNKRGHERKIVLKRLEPRE